MAERRRLLSGKGREQRADNRQHLLGGYKPRVSSGQPSLLEDLSVLPITKARYEQDVEVFGKFASEHGFPLVTAEQVDTAMTEFLDYLFLEEEDVAAGQ